MMAVRCGICGKHDAAHRSCGALARRLTCFAKGFTETTEYGSVWLRAPALVGSEHVNPDGAHGARTADHGNTRVLGDEVDHEALDLEGRKDWMSRFDIKAIARSDK